MKSKRVEQLTWLVVSLAIVSWTIMAFVEGRSTKGFMGILTIGSLIAIGVWQIKGKHQLPPLFAIMSYSFIFVSVGLGTFSGGYQINHFDDFLHVTSGIWIGYGAWLFMKMMIHENVLAQISKMFIAIYIIIFALAVAGLWELAEFAGDKLFHFTAQGRDPSDTMYDMIDGLIGGIVTALFIVRNLKTQS